jgi:ATP-dependent protease ClpP protease subunit
MNKEIKLYGSIGSGEINGIVFSKQLSEIEASGCKNLTIRMHCAGGSVFEGYVIYNALKGSKMHIKIVIDGIAASMASILLLAVKDVAIAENGFVMVHRPSSGEMGDVDAHLAAAKLLKNIESNFIKCISERTKMTENDVKIKWFDGKDHWLNADEAIEYGFASSKVNAVAKQLKTLDKGVFASMEMKNIYDKYESSLNNNKNEIEMKKELIDLFGLQGLTEESPDTDVLEAIKQQLETLKQSAEVGKKMVENNVKQTVQAAVQQRKIPQNMVNTYENIGMTTGLDALTSILDSIKPKASILSMITSEKQMDSSSPKNKSQWGLDEYRMHAPNELRDNPKLYDELYEKEYGVK